MVWLHIINNYVFLMQYQLFFHGVKVMTLNMNDQVYPTEIIIKAKSHVF